MLSIPECNKKKTYELRDLYNGFRILYKVMYINEKFISD